MPRTHGELDRVAGASGARDQLGAVQAERSHPHKHPPGGRIRDRTLLDPQYLRSAGLVDNNGLHHVGPSRDAIRQTRSQVRGRPRPGNCLSAETFLQIISCVDEGIGVVCGTNRDGYRQACPIGASAVCGAVALDMLSDGARDLLRGRVHQVEVREPDEAAA